MIEESKDINTFQEKIQAQHLNKPWTMRDQGGGGRTIYEASYMIKIGISGMSWR
jgi:hypothetical protein